MPGSQTKTAKSILTSPMLVAEHQDCLVVSRDGKKAALLRDGKVVKGVVPSDVTMRPIEAAAPLPIRKRRSDEPVVTEIERAVTSLVRVKPLAASLSPDAATLLLTVWFISILLRPRIKARPIPVLFGEPGCGKTTLARRMGQLIVGPDFEVSATPRSERDAMVLLAHTPVAVFDNMESVPTWFADFFARLSTGGDYATRKLYSDAGLVRHRPDVNLIVTAINPPLLRGDLLHRMLPLRLAPIEDGQRRTEHELGQEVRALRPAVWRELLDLVARAYERLNTSPQVAPTERLADFQIIGRAVVEEAYGDKGLQEFERALLGMRDERRALAERGSPLLAALLSWARQQGVSGAWYRVADIYDGVMEELTGAPGAARGLQSPQQLGRFLTGLQREGAGLVHISKRRDGKGVEYKVEVAG